MRVGLVPFGDWIIGYSGGILRGEGDFYDVVEAVSNRFRIESSRQLTFFFEFLST